MTRINETHKKRIVRAAGAENSSSPVALPTAFLLKFGKKVADAAVKRQK